MAEHKWHLFRKYSSYIEYQTGQTQARKANTRPTMQRTEGPYSADHFLHSLYLEEMTNNWSLLIMRVNKSAIVYKLALQPDPRDNLDLLL